jgi:hypothetical protein
MPIRIATVLAAFVASAVRAQTPSISAAGWQLVTDAACPGGSPCVQLTVAGSNFSASPGVLQRGDFLAPAPPPPTQPWDTPAELFPADLATRVGGNGVCVARSLYTGDGFHYRFCPFQRVEHFSSNGFSIGNLGQYTGVIRDNNNQNCPGANAITGMTFEDGSICNGVPSSSTVNFVCVDVLGAGLVDWGTRTPMVDSAVRSADGCSVNMTLPLPGACDGARFALCGSAQASPNPQPTASPTITYETALVTSWADNLVTALMAGTVPPPAVRVRTAALALSTGFEPEGPGALPPSPSARPNPFPALTVLSMTPSEGVRGVCTPVTVRGRNPARHKQRARAPPPSPHSPFPPTPHLSPATQIQLAGVSTADVTGSGFNQIVQLRLPTGPSTGQRFNFLGLPGPVNGAVPVAPFNGLLNVTLPCLNAMGNWPTFPQTVTATFGCEYCMRTRKESQNPPPPPPLPCCLLTPTPPSPPFLPPRALQPTGLRPPWALTSSIRPCARAAALRASPGPSSPTNLLPRVCPRGARCVPLPRLSLAGK